jgi:hypothetical protein
MIKAVSVMLELVQLYPEASYLWLDFADVQTNYEQFIDMERTYRKVSP